MTSFLFPVPFLCRHEMLFVIMSGGIAGGARSKSSLTGSYRVAVNAESCTKAFLVASCSPSSFMLLALAPSKCQVHRRASCHASDMTLLSIGELSITESLILQRRRSHVEAWRGSLEPPTTRRLGCVQIVYPVGRRAAIRLRSTVVDRDVCCRLNHWR